MAKLYTWGGNANGQLGLGDTTDRSTPVQVGSRTDWTQIVCANYFNNSPAFGGLRGSGLLYMWGYNQNGTLGLNVAIGGKYSTPQQVGALSGWTYSASGYSHSGWIKGGQLFMSGYNSQGQLGTGNTTRYSSPVLVASDKTWAKIFAGAGTTMGITSSGQLWSWGVNTNGILGNGTAPGTNLSSPVQVGTGTNWKQVAISSQGDFAIAVTTDGKLYSWGHNQAGQLGLNNLTNYSTPQQVGALTTWTQVATSSGSGSALKTDGTLWQWGGQGYGEGPKPSNSSPVQQPNNFTDWKKIGGAKSNIFGLKTTGKLYAWGQNNHGQLGQGTSDGLTHSVPLQIGSSTLWSDIPVASGLNMTGALLTYTSVVSPAAFGPLGLAACEW